MPHNTEIGTGIIWCADEFEGRPKHIHRRIRSSVGDLAQHSVVEFVSHSSPVLWVVGFEEHFELNAVGVLERQYRTVFTLGDWRVGDAEPFKPAQPFV